MQVADRFHLLQNLREALQRLLDQHLADIQAAQLPAAEPTRLPGAELPGQVTPLSDDPIVIARTVDPPSGAPRTRRERLQGERRARRQERYTKVREL